MIVGLVSCEKSIWIVPRVIRFVGRFDGCPQGARRRTGLIEIAGDSEDDRQRDSSTDHRLHIGGTGRVPRLVLMRRLALGQRFEELGPRRDDFGNLLVVNVERLVVLVDGGRDLLKSGSGIQNEGNAIECDADTVTDARQGL
jgi:hypothetical protein